MKIEAAIDPKFLEIAEAIIDGHLSHLGDDIEIVFLYGSRLRGQTHAFSDLDMSYIPVRESTWHCTTVLVDDFLFDLYPLHWPRLEQWADFGDSRLRILLENKVVYARDEAAQQRFHELGERVRKLMLPESRPYMVEKALGLYESCGYTRCLLDQCARQGDVASALVVAQQLFDRLLHVIMVVNQTPVDTRKLPELMTLHRLPQGFAESVEAFAQARGAGALQAALGQLMDATRELLLAEQRDVLRSSQRLKDAIGTGYSELRADLQKILIACHERDPLRARRGVASIYQELAGVLTGVDNGIRCTGFNTYNEHAHTPHSIGLPDLAAPALAGDFDALLTATEAFDAQLREYLTGNGALIYAFDDINGLCQYLADRKAL